MTNYKRFILKLLMFVEEERYGIFEYSGERLFNEEIVKKLNILSKENEQLKYSLSAHMVDLNNYKGKCSVLEEENEQLKSENKKLHDTIFALRTENAYDRVTEITKQKDMNVRNFLEELGKW